MPFRNRYSKITLEKRKRLVDMVVTQKIPIVKAAKRLSIKSITARFIVAKYEKQGTFTVRKSDLVNGDSLPETPEVSSHENVQEALIPPVRQSNQIIETLDARNRQHTSMAGWQWLWNGYGWVLCPFFA